MTDSDIFREVDEEIRREKFKNLWDKYGFLIVSVALAIVIAVAGTKGWQYWQAKRAADGGAVFLKAQALSSDGKGDDATKIFQKLIDEGPGGYQLLARFRLATGLAEAGKTEEAVKAFDAIAASAGSDNILRDFARIQAAMLRIDKAKFDEIKSRLGKMTTADNPWRHSARELMGLSAFNVGALEEAEKLYNAALADPAVPQNLRQRAEMMLALIVEQSAKPASGDAKAEDTSKSVVKKESGVDKTKSEHKNNKK